MRDWLLLIFILALIPLILRRAYIGVLAWSWLGYMNPHRMTWGFSYDFPFAQLVGLTTLVALVFDKDRKPLPVTPLTVTWLLFVFWMNVTTFFALVPGPAVEEWDRMMKIQLFIFVSIVLMQEPRKLHYLIWVVVGSIAFFGIKGGLFSVFTGGEFRVWGPAGSFIEGNNEIGLAMTMVAPLIWYLYLVTKKKWIRLLLLTSLGLNALAILTTHSRGAFLAVGAMFVFLWLRSRQKVMLGLILVIAAPVMWASMPEHWHERMGTIVTYEEDGSAQGRINAWYFAYNLSLDRPVVGGGFNTFTPALFERYAPNPEDFHDAHSIYFEVLGEHGFVGLTLFLALGFLALSSARSTAKMARGSAELSWVVDLASMLQASLVAYAVGGLFLGLAYFDLYYQLIAFVVILRVHTVEQLASDSVNELTYIDEERSLVSPSR